MPARPPDDEVERLAALRDHQILDTPPSEEYEDLVRLAAHVCNVPIAAVSLIDENRQWFKAITGLDAIETSRDVAFCAHTILQPGLMVVPDTESDPRFFDNPFVTGDPHARFYAGVPLVTEDGYALGSLCVIDRTPRTLTSAQQETLRLLARQVASHLKAARRVAHHERLVAERESLVAEKEHLSTAREYAEAEWMRLAAIVESSEDAILGATLDGIIISWNKGAEKLYGCSAVEMIGRHLCELAGSHQQSPVPDVVIRLLRGETIAPIEMLPLRKDGTPFHAVLSFSPIRDAFGEMVGLSCIVRDITDRKRMEQELQESHNALVESQRFAENIATNSTSLIYVLDLDTMASIYSNRDAAEFLGYTQQQITAGGESFIFDIIHPEDRPYARSHFADFAELQDGKIIEFEQRVRHTSGEWHWLWHREVVFKRHPDGTPCHILGTAQDVTERKQTEERFRVLFEHSSNAHLLFDEEGGIIDCNSATLSMMHSADKAQLLGIHPALLSPEFQPDGRRSDEAGKENCALAWQNGIHRFEWRRRAVDGYEYPVEVTLTPVTLDGKSALLSVWYDLTERKRAEEQLSDHAVIMEFQKAELERANAELERLAATDGLTGLMNHRTFQERLAQEVSNATRYHTPLSIILLDVDNFKQYNDTYGHPAGDEVLKMVGDILYSCARKTDTVARYGGEEFVLILPQTDREGAAVIAERIREALEKAHWPRRVVTASLGVSSLSLGMDNSGDLIARADAALYQSKSEGRNRITCDGWSATERGLKADFQKRHRAALMDIAMESGQKLS